LREPKPFTKVMSEDWIQMKRDEAIVTASKSSGVTGMKRYGMLRIYVKKVLEFLLCSFSRPITLYSFSHPIANYNSYSWCREKGKEEIRYEIVELISHYVVEREWDSVRT
jgi:hypothetical protein